MVREPEALSHTRNTFYLFPPLPFYLRQAGLRLASCTDKELKQTRAGTCPRPRAVATRAPLTYPALSLPLQPSKDPLAGPSGLRGPSTLMQHIHEDVNPVNTAATPAPRPELQDESVTEEKCLTPTPAAEGTKVPAHESQLPRAGSLHRAAACHSRE